MIVTIIPDGQNWTEYELCQLSFEFPELTFYFYDFAPQKYLGKTCVFIFSPWVSFMLQLDINVPVPSVQIIITQELSIISQFSRNGYRIS